MTESTQPTPAPEYGRSGRRKRSGRKSSSRRVRRGWRLPKITWNPDWLAVGFVILVLGIALTQPIADGDLFWHMAYAKQMLARGSLIPDHALYSWTPASNATIYCAWLGELLLYGIHQAAGWDGLFALRYGLLLACLVMLLQFARASGLRVGPVTTAVILISMVVSAKVAVNLKPEMLSVVFAFVVLWAYFNGKRRDRMGYPAWGYFLVVPVTMLLWVNSHGGFLMIAPVLLAIALGELLNRALRLDSALRDANLVALLVCWSLCLPAVLATPYGLEYPRQLIAEYLVAQGVPQKAYEWNLAYQSIWSAGGWDSYLPQALALMLAVALAALGVHAWRRGRHIDLALVLALAAGTALYLLYLRTTFVLPIVFGFAVLHLAGTSERLRDAFGVRRGLTGMALALMLTVGAVSMYESFRHNGRSGFFGLGINYDNPVEESEFVARQTLPRDMYNIFDSGGYLLWRLYPQHRVMVDSRAFPYYAWFDDQYAFTNGDRLNEFVTKYRADLAIIDLEKGPVWRGFARSKDWQPLFYGPAAAVFVRRGTAQTDASHLEAAGSLTALKSGRTAQRVFDFAVYMGDYGRAWRVLEQMQGSLRATTDAAFLKAATDYRTAHVAAERGDFAKAFSLLDGAMHGKVISEQEKAVLLLLRALVTTSPDAMFERARIEAGLRKLLNGTP